jgi:hypothetical protein
LREFVVTTPDDLARQEAGRQKRQEDQQFKQKAERQTEEEEQRKLKAEQDKLKAEQERERQETERKKRQEDQRNLMEMTFGPPVAGEILYEGLLRRKKEDHGRFEDPYKMVCVCRLQGSVLRVRLTHNGSSVLAGLEEQFEVLAGLEEQFDLKREWRLMPKSDKA